MTRQTDTLTRTCRTKGCTAPEDADHRTLHSTGTEALLTAAYALTHRMDREHGDTPAAADLRAQRDLITAEVLRRAGEQS